VGKKEKVVKKIIFFVLILCWACEAALAAETIKIGLMCPLTGPWSSEGREMKQVVEILADELNEKGGLLGKKVDVFIENDGGDPQAAALAARRLVTRNVAAVIGAYGSAISEATQTIYNDSKIIQIASGSTAIRLSERGFAYFFRICPRDDEQARVVAKTFGGLGYERIAILYDEAPHAATYSKGLAKEVKGLLKKQGADLVFYDALTAVGRVYTAILDRMKAANPDVVLFTGYYPEAGRLLRQRAKMNWTVPFIGGDANNNPDLFKVAGKGAARGFSFVSPPIPRDLPGTKAKKFLARFTKKFHRPPASIWAVLAGDGFEVIASAIGATRSTDPDKLADYLHGDLEDFPGLTGKISFDDKGDRVGELYRLYTVDDKGNFVLQP
jgi:branched-chain amino acid transport system substrate-binding protein